jgi:Domain of unknown function (DUF4331)
VRDVSNHFNGLSLGPPLGDPRLDLCDLYAFQSPTDSSRTVLILTANANGDALHPEAIYRLAIDTDGDLVDDVAFSFVFSSPVEGRQTVNVFIAHGEEARSPEPIGAQIFTDVEVSFGSQPNVATAGDITLAAGARSDAFFVDSAGVKNLFDTSGTRNFTAPHLAELGGKSPWTGRDAKTQANVFSIAIELPIDTLGTTGPLRIWAAAACVRTAHSIMWTGPDTRR